MNSHIKNLIDAIASGDDEAATASWEAAVNDKMSDALDSKRIEIANGVYNTVTDEEAVEFDDEEDLDLSLDSETEQE